MTSIKEALKIIQRTIKGDQIEAAVVDVGTMMPLGKVVSDALAQLDSADARSAPWRYEVQHGPDGEADYAWVYDEANNLICTAKTHHAKAIVDRLSTGLLPDASPGKAALHSTSAAGERLTPVSGPVQPGDVLRYEIDEETRVGKVLEHLRPLGAIASAAGETREPVWQANLREAWAALAMIRETVETLGPVGAMQASEYLDGPTFMHEAEAIISGISKIAAGETRPTMPRGGIKPDWYAESVKLYRQNKALRTALQEQHDWHLAQGDKDFGDGITLNMANEYGDSGMCERTTSILSEVLPSGIQGYEAWKAKRGDAAGETTSSDVEACGDSSQASQHHNGDLQPSTSEAIPADAGKRISQLAADLVVSGWMAGDHGIERVKKEAEDKLLAFACDEIERHMKRRAVPADVLAMKEACKRVALEYFDFYSEKHRAAVMADDNTLYQAMSIGMSASEKIAAAIDKLSPEVKAEGEQHVATITYTNWRGETSVRRIIPKAVRYGVTAWHPQPQWLVLAWDDDKQADREFALKDFGVKADASPPDWKQDQAETTRIKPPATAEGGRGEPVAWRVKSYLDQYEITSRKEAMVDWRTAGLDVEPLYTHPASPPDVEAIRADEREKHSDQICESLLVLSHGYINNPADDAIRIALSNASVFIFGKDRARRIACAIRTGGQK